LIVELTGNFLKVNLDKYVHYIRATLDKINPDEFAKVKRIYFLPLLKKKDYGKSKSATTV
jgi:hypothetical protein